MTAKESIDSMISRLRDAQKILENNPEFDNDDLAKDAMDLDDEIDSFVMFLEDGILKKI